MCKNNIFKLCYAILCKIEINTLIYNENESNKDININFIQFDICHMTQVMYSKVKINYFIRQ